MRRAEGLPELLLAGLVFLLGHHLASAQFAPAPPPSTPQSDSQRAQLLLNLLLVFVSFVYLAISLTFLALGTFIPRRPVVCSCCACAEGEG
jgi:hypothetical protein